MRDNLPESLKPFYQRAIQAEERLARLETALASKKDIRNAQLPEQISELQSKLEQEPKKVKELVKELMGENRELKGANKELTGENEKQKYRIQHLVRALKAADEMIERMQGSSGIVSATTDETTSRLKDVKI